MTIYHIVYVKFTPGSTLAQKKGWRDSITGLASLPQVKEMISGDKLDIGAGVPDGGWEDGVIIKFDSLEDLRIYAKSDEHTAYIEATKEQTKGHTA